MNYSREQILGIMNHARYPLSSTYDPDWILDNAMGSHCLWLQEALTQVMDFKPGMRVLDMGCGKAIGSVFLARQFNVTVYAVDLRIDPSENWKRACDMGVGDRVIPIRADANALPFANGFFDAMVSINSLFLYATGEGFLREHLLRNIRPDGQIGFVVPSFLHEYDDEYPEAYRPFLDDFGLRGWHTAAWWKSHLERTGLADVMLADHLAGDEGQELFHQSAYMWNAHEEPFNAAAWEDITLSRIIAKRK